MKQLPFKREFLQVSHNRGKKRTYNREPYGIGPLKKKKKAICCCFRVETRSLKATGERNRDAILRLAHSKGKHYKRIAPSISPGSRHDFWLYGNLTNSIKSNIEFIDVYQNKNLFSFEMNSSYSFHCPKFGEKHIKISNRPWLKFTAWNLRFRRHNTVLVTHHAKTNLKEIRYNTSERC